MTASDTRQHARQPGQRPAPTDSADSQDYYGLLGVPYSADRAEITRAYRAAMKRAHPDRHAPAERAAAEEHAKRLNLAYSTLAHPESRRTYDSSIKSQTVQDQLMTQYFGGFDMPGSRNPTGEHLRRPPTAAERREKEQSDRQAMISVVIVFAIVTLAVIVLLVVFAGIDEVIEQLL